MTSDVTGYLTSAAADPSAALLPIQEAYYRGMLASTPARMFMSSGSSSGSAASGLLANSPEALLDKVATLVDTKIQGVSSGVARQLGSWGSAMAHMAGAHQVGGLSVPHGWQTGPGMTRAAPILPGTSVAAPSTVLAGSGQQPVHPGVDRRDGRPRHRQHGLQDPRTQGGAPLTGRRVKVGMPLPHNALTAMRIVFN